MDHATGKRAIRQAKESKQSLTMTSNSSSTDAFTQLDELSQKRSALEELIGIAASLHQQQSAMDDLSILARPSQEIPAKTVKQLQAFEDKYGAMDDTELNQWLDSIEQATLKVLSKVSQLAELEAHELRDHEDKGLSVEGFKNLIADFEKRTQISLALRFMLKKRGVVLAAFKLPFAQDSIAEQVEQLRQKEERCVIRIRQDANSILEDTRALLANPTFTGKMKAQLLSVQEAMIANLEHLDNGGSVLTLPNKFDVIEQEPDSTTARKPAPAPATTPAPGSKAAAEPPVAPTKNLPPRKKLTTFQLFLKWLSTPLSTSWKALKEENEREN